MLQIASKINNFCSKMLQIACKWEISLPNAANLIFWLQKAANSKESPPDWKTKKTLWKRNKSLHPFAINHCTFAIRDWRLKLESHAKHMDRYQIYRYLNSSTRAVSEGLMRPAYQARHPLNKQCRVQGDRSPWAKKAKWKSSSSVQPITKTWNFSIFDGTRIQLK